MKFQEESRKLAGILLKESATYPEQANKQESRVDKFGNAIDRVKRKQKIAFNEDLQVYEVENWKKYNSNFYDDDDDDKC